MNTEYKISLAILLLGGLAAGFYWYGLDASKEVKEPPFVEERIILPQYPVITYQQIPEVQDYLNDLGNLIKQGQSVLPLENNELDEGGQVAQTILLNDTQFLEDTVREGKRLHNDMMRIRPAIVSVLNEREQSICLQHSCYQAEKYNFVTNATTRAVVDVDDKTVLSVTRYSNMQPDISLRLTRIAQQIAIHAPEVKKELDYTPSLKDMSMANVRASLQQSPCENSRHLCVAPTFADHQQQRALWAIVDLTELKLVAAKWAGLGKTTTPASISERSLQNRVIMEKYCKKNTVLDKDGWRLVYRLTGSDGLEIRDVSFQGNTVLRSGKIVDWHVSYQQAKGVTLDTTQETYMAGRRVEYSRDENNNYYFGYNDAMGCPMFSTSAVLPFNAPQIRDIHGSNGNITGFYLSQDFRNPKWPMACNYRYENRFEFYHDGSFRIVGVNIGRGCGDNAVYRPVIRLDMAIDDQEVFYSHNDDQWVQLDYERKIIQQTESGRNRQRYPYKITATNDSRNGYYIQPDPSWRDGGSKDSPGVVFVTLFKPEEGDNDLLTLGSCCNFKQDGVEDFLMPAEDIDGANIVLWFVPRIQNNAKPGSEYCWADTMIGNNGNLEVKQWPCEAGPKFSPIPTDISE